MTTTTSGIQPIAATPASRYAGLAFALGLWLLLALTLSSSGVYTSAQGGRALAMPMAIVTPVVLFALVFAVSRRTRAVLLGIDTRALVLIPTFIVPLLTITHIIVYLQLRRGRAMGTV